MMTELNYSNVEREDVSIFTDGIVLRQYNEVNNGYDFKILANVAVVNDSNGLHVYGAADEDGTHHLFCNVNQLVGFTDKAIDIHIVDEEVTTYRLPDGETVISPCITESRDFESWALVLYEHSSPVLYTRFKDFDETSYRELTSVLSKLYFI